MICIEKARRLAPMLLWKPVLWTLSSSPRAWRVARFLATGTHDEAIVQQRTRDWLQRSVIGLNLCPFAEKPLKQKRIDIAVIDDDHLELALTHALEQRVAQPGTTLLVCPTLYPNDFASFWETVQELEASILLEYEGTLQIAPFHPLFCFEGSPPDAMDNWTNRSPYPILHILREDEVARAVDQLDGDASKVWKRNVSLLEAMGEEWGRTDAERVLRDLCEDERLPGLLKQFRGWSRAATGDSE